MKIYIYLIINLIKKIFHKNKNLLGQKEKITRILYPDCDKGELHEGELTNIICLHKNCKEKSICCMVCVDEVHSKHPVKSIKTIFESVRNLPKEEGTETLNTDELLELVTLQKDELLIDYDKFVQDFNIRAGDIKAKYVHFFDRLKEQIIAKVKSQDIIQDAITSCQQTKLILADFQKKITQLQDACNFTKDGKIKQEDVVDIKEVITNATRDVKATFQQKFKASDKCLVDQTKYIDFLLGGNILDLGKQQDFKFSEFKHNAVKILNPTTVRGEGTSSYKFAIMEPALKPDVKTKFAFKMKAGSFQWLAVGVCHKQKVLNNNYGFVYSNTGHGGYMISSNAGTWSTNDHDKNNIVAAFNFKLNDIVIVTYDPETSIIYFEHKTNKNKFEIPFKIDEEDPIHPCVLFHYPNDTVQFINNYQPEGGDEVKSNISGEAEPINDNQSVSSFD